MVHSASVNDFIPKKSGMKNAHCRFFQRKFYSNSVSGRRIRMHKATENMVDLSKANHSLAWPQKVNSLLQFRELGEGEFSSSIQEVGGRDTPDFLYLWMTLKISVPKMSLSPRKENSILNFGPRSIRKQKTLHFPAIQSPILHFNLFKIPFAVLIIWWFEIF